MSKQLDDTEEFQRAVTALGKAMYVDNASGQTLLGHWQGINWLVQQWEQKVRADAVAQYRASVEGDRHV